MQQNPSDTHKHGRCRVLFILIYDDILDLPCSTSKILSLKLVFNERRCHNLQGVNVYCIYELNSYRALRSYLESSHFEIWPHLKGMFEIKSSSVCKIQFKTCWKNSEDNFKYIDYFHIEHENECFIHFRILMLHRVP